MKNVLIIGSGISGLSCAISCAELGMKATILSPYVSERAQSVLAAGGINAVLDVSEDSIESHIEDTLKGGAYIAGTESVKGLCTNAPDVVRWLERLGTVFTRENGEISRRAFGGQSHNRTCYCGAATGKQIVTALTMEARRFEGKGLIRRMIRCDFYSALIKDGRCYGAVVFNENTGKMELIRADALVIAAGGQNALFGKTTGSQLCDGYAAGRLFMQGVDLKNLEFIQYHPTTIKTVHKKMLVSEAARGEGGRLYYLDGDRRVYFMEDKFGPGGNLMPRDIVSKCIYETHKQVYLDVTFLGKETILKKIPEIYELCQKYYGIDISQESIPVDPSVHFFMGGIAVRNNHETNIKDLYAVGECASIYHGANRLGGNSLLAAAYSGRVAAASIAKSAEEKTASDDEFKDELKAAQDVLTNNGGTKDRLTVKYVRDMLAQIMNRELGIVRCEEDLKKGIEDIEHWLSVADEISQDDAELPYYTYSLNAILVLAKAVLICALERRESRGAHLRSDHPETSEEFKVPTIISYDDGRFTVTYDREGRYES